MNAPTAKLMVLIGEQFACVKVVGRANFATSVDFKTVLLELEGKGYPYIVIELSECPLMDSTFLGVLAAAGIRMNPENVECVKQAIELRNLFKTCNGAIPECEAVESTSCQPTREALTRASLEAHQTLMQINPDNIARFKDVTKFLAEDLEKLKRNPSR